jgi:hypothetical protein
MSLNLHYAFLTREFKKYGLRLIINSTTGINRLICYKGEKCIKNFGTYSENSIARAKEYISIYKLSNNKIMDSKGEIKC